MIDEFTKLHLHNWVMRSLPTAEWERAEARMLAFVEEDPSWLDAGWWRVYDASNERTANAS